MCAVALGLWAHPLPAEEGRPMQPLPDGWWHLSLEDIRAGEAKESAKVSADRTDTTSSTRLELRGRAKQSQTRKAKSFDLSIRDEPKTESGTGSDSDADSSRPETRQSSPGQSSTDSTKDTTLRDYTSPTTRALQNAGAVGSTNTFRPMATTLPVKNLQTSLFNPAREKVTGGIGSEKQDKDATDKDALPSMDNVVDVIEALPGSSHYSVPSSPLAVVKSSIASPQFQTLTSPYPSTTAPADSSKTTSADATSKTTSTNTPSVVGVNTNTMAGTSTAKAASNLPANVGWVPGTNPQQGFQPAGASQPLGVVRRPGGPNANGFYEPKSISDLQLRR